MIEDYLREVGGQDLAKRFMSRQVAEASWVVTGHTLDFATGSLPDLLYHRMDELGIDYSIIYPTRLLTGNSIPQEDTRKAVCRAYNKMVADIYVPHKARLTPAALIPCLTPQEAIDEVEYAVNTLGLKVGSFKGSQRRPIPEYEVDGAAPNTMPYYVDALGLDNLYDYGWIADYPDPENFLDVLLHSKSSNNHIGYSNQQVDRLLEQADNLPRLETDRRRLS